MTRSTTVAKLKKKSSILSHKMNRGKLQHFLCSIEPFFSCHFTIWTRKRWEFNNFFIIIAHKEFSPPLSPSCHIYEWLRATFTWWIHFKFTTQQKCELRLLNIVYQFTLARQSLILQLIFSHLIISTTFYGVFFHILQKIDKHWRLLKV